MIFRVERLKSYEGIEQESTQESVHADECHVSDKQEKNPSRSNFKSCDEILWLWASARQLTDWEFPCRLRRATSTSWTRRREWTSEEVTRKRLLSTQYTHVHTCVLD